MGFQKSSKSYAQYASFAQGAIVMRSNAPRDGFTPRVNKIGNTVYEQQHEEFEGTLYEIEYRDGDYGAQWMFKFTDGSDEYILTDRVGGSYAQHIISALAKASVDLSQPITLAPWKMDRKDDPTKYVTGCVVRQHGEKITRIYCSSRTPEDKRDGAKPLPDKEEKILSGKVVYDDTEIIKFLSSVVDTVQKRIDVAREKLFAAAINPKSVAATNAGAEPAGVQQGLDALYTNTPDPTSKKTAKPKASGQSYGDVPF